MKRALITGIGGLALTEDEKNFILSVMWCRTASVPMERTGEGGRHPAVAPHRGDVEGHRGWWHNNTASSEIARLWVFDNRGDQMTYIKPILHALTLAATIGASGALYAAEQSTDKPPMTQHPATQTEPKEQPTLESLGESHPAAKPEEPKGPTGDKPCSEHKPSEAAKDPAKKDCGPTQK